MKQDRLNYDAQILNQSHSRKFSDAISFDKEDGFNSQMLDKSGNDKASKSGFFLSMDLEVSKEFTTINLQAQSPPHNHVNNYLSQFSQRFASLRKHALEEDMFNHSLALSLFKLEPVVVEKPNTCFDTKKKSISNKSCSSSQSFHNKNIEITCPGKEESISRKDPPSKNARMGRSKKIKKSDNRLSRFEKLENEFNYVRPVFKHLHKIFKTFLKLFSIGNISPSDYELEIWEEEILFCLIQRKYFVRMSENETKREISEKVEKINEIINSRSNKRPEECYKFILTRINKHLRRVYTESIFPKKFNEKEFYTYYFGAVAEELKEPIQSFYYPITRKQVDKTKLNSAYFDKIFRSQIFVTETIKYINNFLKLEYQDELKQKLRSFLSKYDLLLNKQPEKFEETLQLIKDYLVKNKRCKLPWTVREINESIERFYLLLENYKAGVSETSSY